MNLGDSPNSSAAKLQEERFPRFFYYSVLMQDAPAPNHTNRLAAETSPYLLQHRHNPVDWYPWGKEAFDKARRENKAIFLSVGYATCYWCHVMERQCFEDEAVAALMNEHFVNVKVDREERPDVDQLYMTAVQVMTRQGGWPMSVWLLPDGRPFYGGTYFSPEDSHGRPGLKTLLRGLAEAMKSRADELESTAGEMRSILIRLAGPTPAEEDLPIALESVAVWLERSTADADPVHGGFGGAPKFPRETLLELLLDSLKHDDLAVPDAGRLPLEKSHHARLLKRSLDAMANGGIRDHLGGGFHRYGTDEKWFVPHFEIMGYDNAMLAGIYAEAAAVLSDDRYGRVARGICDFVLRDLTSPDGAFYTAWDAEVDTREGLNYLWTKPEIEAVLPPDEARIFNAAYGLNQGPNFADPHHPTENGGPDKNVLFLAAGATAEDHPQLVAARAKLLAARELRKKPLRDTKILTSWNALMITGLVRAGVALAEPRYVAAAQKAADFLLAHHRTPDGGLYRTSAAVASSAKIHAFLDDYAFFARALLAVAAATGAARYRVEAEALATQMRARFEDPATGGYYFTDRSADDLFVRQQIAVDSPLPAGVAVAAMVLQDLGRIDEAGRTVAAFAQQTNHHAESMSAMVLATARQLRLRGAFVVPAMPVAQREPAPVSPADQADAVVQVGGRWESETRCVVMLHIADGYHLNAARVPDGLIATQLRVAEPGRELVAAVTLPPGVEKTYSFADQPLEVYEGLVELTIDLARPLEPLQTIPLTLIYQACTDSACLPAVTKTFDVGARNDE